MFHTFGDPPEDFPIVVVESGDRSSDEILLLLSDQVGERSGSGVNQARAEELQGAARPWELTVGMLATPCLDQAIQSNARSQG